MRSECTRQQDICAQTWRYQSGLYLILQFFYQVQIGCLRQAAFGSPFFPPIWPQSFKCTVNAIIIFLVDQLMQLS